MDRIKLNYATYSLTGYIKYLLDEKEKHEKLVIDLSEHPEACAIARSKLLHIESQLDFSREYECYLRAEAKEDKLAESFDEMMMKHLEHARITFSNIEWWSGGYSFSDENVGALVLKKASVIHESIKKLIGFVNLNYPKDCE